MPNIAPWQMIPTALLEMNKRRDKARAWGQAQRAVVAKQWGDVQREKVKALTAQVYRQFENYAQPAIRQRAASDRLRTPLTPTQMGATGVGAPITPETLARGGPAASGLMGRRAAPAGPFAAGIERAAPVAAAAGDILGRGQQAVFGAAAPIVDESRRRGLLGDRTSQITPGAVVAGAKAGLTGGQSMGFESLLERAGVGPGLGRTAAGVVGDIVIDPVGILPVGKAAGLAGKAAGLAGKGARAAGRLATADRALGAIAPSMRRMFHGTGSAFDVPDAAKFDANGLFGPGYYLTSDARVAESYAVNRQFVDITGDPKWGGPNIRAVDVPAGLNLLDADSPMGRTALTEFAQRLAQQTGFPGIKSFAERMPGGFASGEFGPSYRTVGDLLSEFGTSTAAKSGVNKALGGMGYDGIKYGGGKRTPMADDTGKAIEHDAVVIFPEAMPKLRNAISGTAGGIVPAGARYGRLTTEGQHLPLETPTPLRVWYHATGADRDFTAFRKGKRGAVYLAQLPEEALRGAQAGARERGLPILPNQAQTLQVELPRNLKVYGLDAPARLSAAEHDAIIGRANNLASVSERIRPIVRELLTSPVTKRPGRIGEDAIDYTTGARPLDWGQVEQPDMQEALRYLGYDAAVVSDEGGVSLAVINPDRLRITGRTASQAADRRSMMTLGDVAPVLGAAAAGGVVGATQQPEDASLGQRVLGGAAGALLGATAAGPAMTAGGRLGAVAKGLPRGAKPIALAAAKEVERLRLDKFPDWARPIVEEAAQATDFGAVARRGVMPEAVQAAKGEATGQMTAVDDWIRRGKIGKSYNTEEVRAIKGALQAQAGRVVAAQRAAPDPLKSTPEQVARLMSEGEKMAALTAMFEGGRAEWGRAGQAWKAASRTADMPLDDAVQRIYRKVGGRENADLLVAEYARMTAAGADIFQQAAFWSRVEKPPLQGLEEARAWFETLSYNSMLSGPRTAEIIALSNAGEVGWKMLRDTAANIATGDGGAIKREAVGALTGLVRGARALPGLLKHGITEEEALAGDLPQGMAARLQNPVKKGVATVLEAPGRVLSVIDTLTSAMVRGMEIGRLAARQVTREKLVGKAWAKRVAELEANPTTEILAKATLEARRSAMRGPVGGTFGKAGAAVAGLPLVGHILMPFYRSGYNIGARAIDRSPIGLIGTGIDVARGAYKGDYWKARPWLVPLEQRLADNLLGTTFYAGFTVLAANGSLTAGGPVDSEKKAMLKAEGWTPYSVKIGDNWVSYANWGPAAYPMAAAAAIYEAAQYKEPDAGVDAVAMDALKRWGEVVTEMTYLQGVGDLYEAVTQTDVYGFGYAANLGRRLIPFGAAVSTVAESQDPLVRSPERFNAGQAISARLPEGLPFGIQGRQSLPPAQNLLGRPIPNQRTGVAAMNPLRVSPERPDVVIAAYREAGIDIGFPPTEIKDNVADADRRLTDAEKKAYQRAMGAFLAQYAWPKMQSAGWEKLRPVDRAHDLKKILENAREEAKKTIQRQWYKATQ